MSALDAVGAALLRASLEGALAVAVVWLVCRLAPGMPAAARCLLWWAACLRFVVALPGWGVATVPVLPAGWPGAAEVERLDTATPADGGATDEQIDERRKATAPVGPSSPRHGRHSARALGPALPDDRPSADSTRKRWPDPLALVGDTAPVAAKAHEPAPMPSSAILPSLRGAAR
ncbi:MAG TPA: hypothetical protein VHM02_11115, partial [Thermoanaerobaculia bacterium]|nr:hypothetical protein [Thermoanaerobaculia bacterium]